MGLGENKMQKQLKKPINWKIAILICLIFLLFFYVWVSQVKMKTFSPNYGHEEFLFHYRKARSDEFCDKFYGVERIEVGEKGEVALDVACKRYPPLFHWISKPFSFNQQHFFLFGLIIICFLIPIILVYIKRHWISALFYWGVAFPYIMESGFHYTQLLATALLVVFIWRKEWYFRIIMLIVAILLHTSAPLLLIAYWIIECIASKKTWKYLFPSCTTGVVLKSTPPVALEQRALGSIKWGYILNWFFKATPLPFIIFAGKQFWKQKQYDLILLSIAMFFAVIIKGRILYSLQIVLLLGLTDYYKQADKKMKIGLIILAGLSIALQVLAWQHYRLGTFIRDCDEWNINIWE
jgi:hypothetical protein